MQKLLSILLLCVAMLHAHAQQFVHPGINQKAADLALMKQQVQKGIQPYKNAFDKLKNDIDFNADVKAQPHVLRGPYGKPNIGGNQLSKGAGMAYDCAVIWYITGEKKYADKAIAILNDWSATVWDFDYNDAKLLAAWTGHTLCNAAEILKFSNAGWQQKDMDRFRQMLMTVYYPLLRYYYPQANGNWDGAIIHSILAMGIYLDDREMFNNGIDHFLHAPVNGSIFKYVFSNGQCQESMRDQGHVQLGLGEFAGAAQVAYTQGVDLFSIGDNRMALGYEYTAGFLLGHEPNCYGGPISQRAKDLRDDYEYVYRHYTAIGVKLPYTAVAADSARLTGKATRSVLTSIRAWNTKQVFAPITAKPFFDFITGAVPAKDFPSNAIMVAPGESLQEALNKAAATNGWVVAKAGLHKFPETLKMPSGVTLSGEGKTTILQLDPASGMREAIVNAEPGMHDVTLRNFVLEGGLNHLPNSDPNSVRSFRNNYNRGGIVFRGEQEGQMKHLNFENITIQNCTFSGLLVSGATGVTLTRCDLNENGASVPPGFKLVHNLHLTHCSNVKVDDCRLATSPFGAGAVISDSKNVVVNRCEIVRNAYYGILFSECSNVDVQGCLVEGNDRSGIMLEYLYRGVQGAKISKNRLQYNAGYGLESYATGGLQAADNTMAGNGNASAQQKISAEKYIVRQ